jgi:glycerol-3-phosphate responsive antiterminator
MKIKRGKIMQIKELIKELKKMNQNAIVNVADIEGNFDAEVLQTEDNDDVVYLLAEL